MQISSTPTAPQLTGPPQASKAESKISSDFETFLKMLTVQIQNQDPLSPIQSEDFAVQLATFSGVEQQVRTNDILSILGAQMSVSGMAEIATWVGMEARAAVPIEFSGAPITLSPNPERTADRAELVVRNVNGDEVQRMTIPVSSDPIEWTGLDDNGNPFLTRKYSFEIESYANGTLSSTDPVEAYGRIVEVRSEAGQTILVMQGGAELDLTDVTALRQPRV